ncbi:BZ3500_MvSof-1268-A1-R1_Chr10-1g02689 [Microbotryum saponariae]|uniref:BZ3500_MvSof-1268-A1-R1_Chr10-1g02689 protein n=1 Tax=Microbotryum saponariae TaxID=289078 RepID=A0A2X0LLX0_9BASI|nr:BZ3500_MvSof-1268-A1-R1_Chr10-1g02689 [Microbotryum saponariae]SDA06178.1 BZ3501_MvSof-1269-A2-R1_Chr10-1g02290 [Microbotryum saponariae]
MSTSTSNHLNPNAYAFSPETVQYRLQLSYLLAPLSKGQFATQPHLIDSQTITTTPDSSNTKLTCPACQATLIVGVNATVRTHRNGLWRRCLGCRRVSKEEGGEGKGRGKERFRSVKQRHKMEKAAVLESGSGSQNGTKSIEGTSSRKLTKAVSDLARTRVPGDAMQGLESTTATSQTGLSRAVPISAPSSVPSPTPSKPNFTSKPVALNSEPRVRPSSHTKSTTTTHQNQVKSTNKRSKTTTSGLAELLAAKKLERERANQAGGTSGGMGLQQFLQSI